MKRSSWVWGVIIGLIFLISAIWGLSNSFCFNCGSERSLNIFTFPTAFIFYFFISKNFFDGINPFLIVFIQFIIGFIVGYLIHKIIKRFTTSSFTKKGYLLGLLFIFIVLLSSPIYASIQGNVIQIQSTPQEDIKTPFVNATLRFFSNETTYDIYSDENGNFNFNLEKDIDKMQVIKDDNILSEKTEINYKSDENKSLDVSFIIFYQQKTIESNQLMKASAMSLSSSESSSCPDYSYYNNYYSYNVFHWGWTNNKLDLNKIPVLLVHGWGNEAKDINETWSDFETELRNQGYEVWRLQYWPANLSNRKNAGIIRSAISDILGKGYKSSKVDVVTHSMGGLAVRGYIQGLGENVCGFQRGYNNNIRKHVIIASPMYGSYFANLIDSTSSNSNSVQKDCWDFVNKYNLNGGTEATKDMEIGSDFTWELNTQPLNKNVDYLTISGSRIYSGWIGDYFVSDCIKNIGQTNDAIVPLMSSILISNNVPMVLLYNSHSTPIPYAINININTAKIASLFLKDQLNYTSAHKIIDTNSGELYYNPLNPSGSDSLPNELTNFGGIVIKIEGKHINKLKLNNFQLEPLLPENKTWIYTGFSKINNYTNLLPKGTYKVYADDDYINQDIEIKAGQVTMKEINLNSQPPEPTVEGYLCTPKYTHGHQFYHINNISISNMDSSDASNNPLHYNFFNTPFATLEKSKNYTLFVNTYSLNPDIPIFLKAWIDFNDDLAITSNEELDFGVYYNPGTFHNFNKTFVVPSNIDTKDIIVRVAMKLKLGNENSPVTSCDNSNFSQTYDYLIKIIDKQIPICTPKLVNTSWSDWTNWSCTTNDKMNQTRSRIQYDSNNCETIFNQTFYEYQINGTCDYCTPNWINVFSCDENGSQIAKVNDFYNCFNETGLSNDLLGKPESKIYLFSCDYHRNGIIGKSSDLNSNYKNISILINGSSNLLDNFTGIQKVEIMEGSKKLLEFNFTFNFGEDTGNSIGLNLVKYLNEQTNGGVEYVSYSDLGNIYQVLVNYQNQTIPVYVTKDGIYFVQGATPLDINNSDTIGSTLSGEVAGKQLVDFLNTKTNGGVEYVSYSNKGYIYEINVTYMNETIPVYVTKDGRYFIQGIEPIVSHKSDKPNVELFVMSYCPYGTQAEKGIIPAVENLGNKINFKIRFVHYFMHGDNEETETYNQVCIREEQSDKYLNYVKCFVNDGNSSRCLSIANVNITKLNTCLTNNKSKEYYAVDSNLSQQYGVQGSPTLIINGIEVYSDRSPNAFLESICLKFNIEPSECFNNLSTQYPSAGFGSGSSGSGGDCAIASSDSNSTPVTSPGNSSGGGGGGIIEPIPTTSPSVGGGGGGYRRILNLGVIKILRQENNSNFASIIINGLDLSIQNQTKTIYIDRILNGTGICIKDAELNSTSEISDSCTSTDETWMKCPDSKNGYFCELVENDTRYKISGLKHSGIKEQSTYCGDGTCNGGESCSSCSTDCGGCGGGGGGGGGGSGGGGGGGSYTPKANAKTPSTTTTTSTTNVPSTTTPTQNAPETNTQQQTPSLFSRIRDFFRITGFAVADTGQKTGYIFAVIFIVVIIAVAIIIMVVRRKRNSETGIIVTKYSDFIKTGRSKWKWSKG